VLRLATLAVMQRTGETGPVPASAIRIETRRVDVSSTEIRDRVGTGRTIRGFVPEAVAAYIADQRLYR
jgi:nicotinate-nucleotide adenylyltransferase